MAASEQPHHAKKRKAHKQLRNFRINGPERGKDPITTTLTKYMRSGGAGRMAHRKAKNHGCNKPSAHLGKNGERDH